MAQGDYKTFHNTGEETGSGGFDFTTDTFATAFFSDFYTAVDISVANPNISNYTEVTGGTYAPKNLINPTWTRAAAITTFNADDFTGANEWPRDAASGPTDIRTAIVYKVSDGVPIGVMDMTADGTTPISLQAAPIGIIWNANGIYQQQVTV